MLSGYQSGSASEQPQQEENSCAAGESAGNNIISIPQEKSNSAEQMTTDDVDKSETAPASDTDLQGNAADDGPESVDDEDVMDDDGGEEETELCDAGLTELPLNSGEVTLCTPSSIDHPIELPFIPLAAQTWKLQWRMLVQQFSEIMCMASTS